jgi:hypothetical protein
MYPMRLCSSVLLKVLSPGTYIMHPSGYLDAPLSKVLHSLLSVGLFGAEQKGMCVGWYGPPLIG